MNPEKTASNNFVYDFETDRRNKFIALIIFFSSVIIFALSVLGFIDSISNQTAHFLQTQLGLTNKWSTSFGPDWFVGINKDISALGGFPLLPIFFRHNPIIARSKRRMKLIHSSSELRNAANRAVKIPNALIPTTIAVIPAIRPAVVMG